MKCSARIISPGNEIVDTSPRLEPESWGAVDVGGYEAARCKAVGGDLWSLLDFLGYELAIYSPSAVLVWRGKIVGITVQESGISAGMTLESLANRVKVEYVVKDSSGGNVALETDWLEDADSIQKYGIYELVETLGDGSDAQALALRAQTLAERSKPMVELDVGSSGGERSATIDAVGHYEELATRYYKDDSGLLEHDVSGSMTVPIGFQITTTEFRFSAGNSIYDFSGLTYGLKPGTEILISGGSNQGRVVLESEARTYQVYTSPTISFVEEQTIRDVANGLGFLTDARWVKVTGSALNSGYWLVTSDGNPTEQRVEPLTIRKENAGPQITLTRPQTWRTNREFVEQVQGTSITVSAGALRVAQSFVITQTEGWPLDQVSVRVSKVGDPSDNLVVSLVSDNNNAPNTLMTSGLKPGSEIGDNAAWHTFTMPTKHTLIPGQRYWIEVKRSGANNGQNYYILSMDETESYEPGRSMYYNGTTWVAPDVPADMLFVLRGALETTTQIQRIVAACGDYITGVELDGNQGSGVYSHQYRDGETDGWGEIEDLIAAGYANGQKMLATVTEGRKLRIHRAPIPNSDPRYHYTVQGELRNAKGGPIEPGEVPVGEYAYIPEVNIPVGSGLNPFYIHASEYHAGSGRYRLMAHRSRNPWDVGAIRPG